MHRFLPLGTVATAAVVALAISFTPAQPIERYTSVTPPRDVLLACQPVGAGTLLADGDGELTVDGAEQRGAPFSLPGTDGLTTLRGIAPSGGMLTDDRTWAPCQRPATSGFLALPAAADAEVRITNPDNTDASIDLTLLGPDGEVTGLGARGIVLSPGESRPVAVSVIAGDVQGPLGVVWQASRGRAVVAGITTGGVTHVAPSGAADMSHVLPGVAEGSRPSLVLVNPGVDRATVSVRFHSPTNTIIPEGGQEISVPPRSAASVDLSAGTAGDPGAFTVQSDLPVAAALYSGAGERRGVAVAAVPDVELTGAVPGGATVQLTNVGEGTADATVRLGGSPQSLRIEPGTTATLPAGEDELVHVEVGSNQPLVGAAVLGEAIVALAPGSVAEPEPVEAELVPSLR